MISENIPLPPQKHQNRGGYRERKHPPRSQCLIDKSSKITNIFDIYGVPHIYDPDQNGTFCDGRKSITIRGKSRVWSVLIENGEIGVFLIQSV